MNRLLIALWATLLATEAAGAQVTGAPAATKLRAQKAQFAPVRETTPVSEPTEAPLRIKREPVQSNTAEQATIPVSSAGMPFMERGKNFSRHGLYKEASDYFTRAAEADQKNAEAYNRRARAEWQLEQNKEALEDVNWAIRLNPDYAQAFCTRAAIHNSMSQYQDAVSDASMAIDLKPNLRDAYMLQAVAYRDLGQHREADEVLNRLNAISQTVSAFDESEPKVDYNVYLTYLQNTVRESWRAPQGAYAPAMALFKIHRNGQVSDLRLNNTTGDKAADDSAIAAVSSCTPFREPPAGTPPDFDVFIVLEPPNRPMPPPATPQGRTAPTVGQFNFNGALYQGIGVMRRYVPF